MDEVSYALEEGKRVIPILHGNCDAPFRLRRLQRIDFTGDYQTGFNNLLQAIGAQEGNREKRIETISEAFKKPAPVVAATPVVPEKPKSNSKKFIMIGGGVLVLALAIFGITKMGGGNDNSSATTTENISNNTGNEVPVDTTVYYFIQNRSNDKVMGVINGGKNENSYGYIVLVDAAGSMQDDSRKINLLLEKGGVGINVKSQTFWVMTDDDGILVEYSKGMPEVKNDVFHFINYKDGYFQITQTNKNFVLGLHGLSADSPEGQKIVMMKNDNSLQTQWKLVPTGESANEKALPDPNELRVDSADGGH